MFLTTQPQRLLVVSDTEFENSYTFSLFLTVLKPSTVLSHPILAYSLVLSTATFAPRFTFYPVSEASHFSDACLLFSFVKSSPLSIPSTAPFHISAKKLSALSVTSGSGGPSTLCFTSSAVLGAYSIGCLPSEYSGFSTVNSYSKHAIFNLQR